MDSILLALFIVLILLFIMVSYRKVPSEKNDTSMVSINSDRNINVPVKSLTPVDYDFNDYVLSSGVDKSVVDSHRRFTSQIQKSTTGASTLTELSGDVYATPFVGLRRPDMQRIPIDANARTVPSEDQAVMPPGNRLYKCGLF